MVKKSKEKQVRTALAEAVKLLCTRELNMCYRNDFLIQGLLGITLDSKDIILIDINEVVKGESMSAVSLKCIRLTNYNGLVHKLEFRFLMYNIHDI